MKIGNILIGIGFVAGLACQELWALHCLDNNDLNANLPTEIGEPGQTAKFPFALNCDTIYVREGVTTIIHPGTILYFLNPSADNFIRVEGTLRVKGTKDAHVILAGSLDSTRNGIEPGNRTWGGMEVVKGGRLEIEFGGFMAAPTPITSFSSQVILLNTWFKGGLSLFFPGAKEVKLDKKWHAINKMDLEEGIPNRQEPERIADGITDKEKAKLLNKPNSGFWNWKTMSAGAAVFGVAGIGATLLFAQEETEPVKVVDKPSIPKLETKNRLPDFETPFPTSP